MDTGFGVLLICGEVLSYGHQIYTILRAGSAQGNSAATVLCGLLANVFIMLNIGVINVPEWVRAGGLSLVPLVQIACSCALGSVLAATVLGFSTRRMRLVPLYALAASATLVATVVVTAFPTVPVARAVALTGVALTAVMWLPQLVTTWVTERPETLSLFSLVVNLFGGVMEGVYQALVAGEDWTVWLTSVVGVAFSSVNIAALILLLVWRTRCPRGPTYAKISFVDTELDVLERYADIIPSPDDDEGAAEDE